VSLSESDSSVRFRRELNCQKPAKLSELAAVSRFASRAFHRQGESQLTLEGQAKIESQVKMSARANGQ
jgi:hypothetical protein